MKEIKVGIFGAARGMAFYNLDRFDGIKVTAICDGNPETLEKVKAKVNPDVLLCKTFDELLASGINAVVLANFFHEHARQRSARGFAR